MKAISITISVLLVPLVITMPLRAAMPVLPGVVAPSLSSSVPTNSNPAEINTLQIRLGESGSAAVEVNSLVTGYSIVVTDASGIPVSDAAVAVRLPEDDPTGSFVDGAHSAVAYTDVTGVATLSKIHWGSTHGTVSIRVTAVKGDLHAGTVLEQKVVEHSETAVQPKDDVQKWPTGEADNVSESLPVPPRAPKAAVPLIPGTPSSVASIHSGATDDDPIIRPAQTSASADPAVTVVNSTAGGSHSSKKWILVAVVAVGAGVGSAMALGMGGKASASAAAPSTGISIGAPSVSVGH